MSIAAGYTHKAKAKKEQMDAQAEKGKAEVRNIIGKVQEKVADAEIAVEEKFHNIKNKF